MPVIEISSKGPKTGDRVLPLNSDRYYFITRIHDNKAYYRWVPGEDSPNKKWEERYCPIPSLVWTKKGSAGTAFVLWTEVTPFHAEQIKPKTRVYNGKINYHGQVIEKETVADSEDRAKSNLIAQIAQQVGVKPNFIWTYIKSHPTSFEMEEAKE